VRAIAVATRPVVSADWLFTMPNGILQPVTGAYMVHLAELSRRASWILGSLLLYVIAMLCWLPMVWLQLCAHGRGRRSFRCSVACALSASLRQLRRIFYLMVFKST